MVLGWRDRCQSRACLRGPSEDPILDFMVRVAAVLAASLLALALQPPRVSASVAMALDLAGLVQRADAIVVGTTTSRRSRWEGRRIVTDVTLSVERALAGRAASGGELALTYLGGEVGDVGMRVTGMPHFRVGGRCLLFGEDAPAGPSMRPVGMSQGVMPVRRRDGRDVVLPGGAGLALVQRSGGGLAPAPAALTHARPLDEVLSEIGELLRKGPGR